VEHGRPRAIPADVAVAVFRVVQEAVTNTIRHAEARHLVIRLEWRDGELRVEVADDGHGRSPSTGDGYGLVGMRERVHALGGQLDVGDNGAGFRIDARIPVADG
jgi:signal transduction histidine kinase